MKRSNVIMTMTVIGFFLLFTFSALTGCQTTSKNRYIGKTVPEPNRISLPEGKTQSNVWQAKDMVFQYSCLRNAGNLSLSGELMLDRSYEQFDTINFIYLWIHYLDSEGIILDSKIAWSVVSRTAYTGGEKKWTIDSSIDLLSNATAATFSYSGSVQQAGEEDAATRWTFYKSPTI